MRLPSHQYDPKDLLRNMSVALDGPEEVIEGDDYLQPTSSITELPEENTTPISNGKVRTLFHSLPATYPRRTPRRSVMERYVHCSTPFLQATSSITELPEENTTPISNGKVRTLFHPLPAAKKNTLRLPTERYVHCSTHFLQLRKTPCRLPTGRFVHCSTHFLQAMSSITEIPEQSTTPISNGKVRTSVPLTTCNR